MAIVEDEDNSEVIDVSGSEIFDCFDYFNEVTPYTISATRTLMNIKKQDNLAGKFHYSVELFKIYKE